MATGLRVLFEDDFNRADGALTTPWKTSIAQLEISNQTVVDAAVPPDQPTTFSQDWSSPDANPWTDEDFDQTSTGGGLGLRISNGGLRPTSYGTNFVVYNGTIDQTIEKSVSIKFAQAGLTPFDYAGPAFINPADNTGYWVRFGSYTNTKIVKIDSGGTETTAAQFTNTSISVDNVIRFTMSLSGSFVVYKDDTELVSFTDTTYNAGLQPGAVSRKENNYANGMAEFSTTLALSSPPPTGDNTRKSYYDQISGRGQWSESTVAVIGPAGDFISPTVLADAAGTTRYSANVQSDQIRLYRWSGGAGAFLGASYNNTLQIGDVVRIETYTDSDDLVIFLDGAEVIRVTDTIISAGFPGIVSATNSGTVTAAMDNFRAGIVAEPAVLTNATGNATSPTSGVGSVQYDVFSGIVYSYVSESVTPPSLADHMDGTGATAWVQDAGTEDGYSGFNWIDQFTEGTQYYAHYLHVYDQLASAQATSPAFTTSPATATPTLSGATGASTGTTTGTGGVDTDTTGGSIWCYVSTSADAPDPLELKTSSYIAPAVVGTVSFTITELVDDTTYYNHYIQTTEGISSSIVSSAPYTTDAIVVPPEPGPVSALFSMVVDPIAVSSIINTSTGLTSFTITWQCNVDIGDCYVSIRTSGVYTDSDAADIKSGLGAIQGPFTQPAVLGTNSITINDLTSGVTYFPGVTQEY